MNVEKFAHLEKEIDKLLTIIDKLQDKNESLEEQCRELTNNHKKDQEVIKTLKQESTELSSAPKIKKSSKTKEAQIKDGLEKIVDKLDNLL